MKPLQLLLPKENLKTLCVAYAQLGDKWQWFWNFSLWLSRYLRQSSANKILVGKIMSVLLYSEYVTFTLTSQALLTWLRENNGMTTLLGIFFVFFSKKKDKQNKIHK